MHNRYTTYVYEQYTIHTNHLKPYKMGKDGGLSCQFVKQRWNKLVMSVTQDKTGIGLDRHRVCHTWARRGWG